MREKGFTLIELLGVIVILSLIMLIAIPNITSTLDRSKREQYLVDAKKFVSLVEYELRKGSLDKPGTTELLQITLDYLNTNDLEKDADGNTYDLLNSYVVVARKNGYLVYYVNLIAYNGTKYKGIKLVDSEQLDKDGTTEGDKNRYSLIENDVNLLSDEEIKETVGIVGDSVVVTKKTRNN